MIRVYDNTGNVIETHEHAGDFKGVVKVLRDYVQREFVNRPFQFHKRSPHFIGAHDEPLTVAMRVNNPDRFYHRASQDAR